MHRVEHVMGMPIVVALRGERDGDETLVDEVFDRFREIDRAFSTFREDSEISRIRRGELAIADASDEVQHVLARCAELRVETDGFFDADACSRGGVDPSGLVKGWAVDEACAILDRANARDYAVNAGGDIRTRGRWTIGIQHPLDAKEVAKVVEGEDLAVATSGAYERGEHVRDPHTGAAPHGILSVTITGPDLATADAYATAAYAMGGHRAPNWTARLRGYEAMTILADGRVLATPGFPAA
ncbi:MAG TPA: FAD:protein FMN transferase [Gaiellaceae bacterium]|nr:FAD:protein FMN transferase [Gaiellaceae bacterium]